MRIFYKKTKYRIVMMIVLAMLLQIIGPVVSNVYAEVMEQSFKIVGESFENGNAYIQWEFTLDPNDKVEKHTHTGNFSLEDAVEGDELKANDGTVIGTYSISTDGEVTVTIDQKLYDILEKEEGQEITGDEKAPDQESVEPKGEEGGGAEVSEDDGQASVEPTDPNGNKDENSEEGKGSDEPNDVESDDKAETEGVIIGSALGMLASISESLGDWLMGDEEEVQLINFSGTIVVEGAKEKEGLLSKINGLFGGADEYGNLGDIFTDVKLTLGEEEITEDITIEINENTNIGLTLKWELGDDVDLQEENWAKIKLPDVLSNVNTGGELTDSDGATVGIYSFEDGYLKVVFNNELVERNEDRHGEVGFLMEFVLDEFEYDASQLMEFGEPIGKTITITAKPSGEDIKEIAKSGVTNTNINPTHINWVIDVNTALDDLEDATVTDIIPEGLELEFDGIVVYELIVGRTGNIELGDRVTNPNIQETSEGFEVNLGKTNKAYRIKYSTKITSYPEQGYTNKAVLKDNDQVVKEAESNISKITRGSLIEKSGWANKNQNATKVFWQIDINKAEESLNNVTIEDQIPQGLSINNIKIFELNKSRDNWKQGNEVTNYFGNSTSFPISFGDIDGKAYRIIVETDIDYGVEYKQSIEFENEAILKETGIQVDSHDATVSVTRDTLLEKSGKETTSYGNPEITWTIHVNKANHNIINATITDTIGEGLKLRQGSIKVNGSTVSVGEDNYPRLEQVGDNGFTLKLGDINTSYTITYITDIINPSKTSFDNTVELKGDGLTGDGIGEDGTITETPSVNPSVNNSYTKGRAQSNNQIDGIIYDGLNYEEKTMSWVTTVDAKKEKITELTITDTFEPAGSMVFVADSLRILNNGVLVDANKYTLTDNGSGGFVLEFKGELDRAKYEIYYKTSFDPDSVLGAHGKLNTGKTYTNKVSFSGKTEDVNGKEKDIDTSNTANYPISDEIFNGGKKDGTLNREGRIITWKVYVNALGQDLTGKEFKIVDTLSGGQVFNDDLKIYEYSLSKDGTMNVDKNKEVTLGNYSVAKTNNGFIVTFSNDIDKPYVIEYTTTIKDISKSEYTNTADVKRGDELYKSYSGKVTYSYHDKFVDKNALNISGSTAYTDDEINWKVTLNESLSEIQNAVFKDTISAGQVYLNDSLKLYTGTVINEDNLVQIDKKDLNVTIDSESGKTTIELPLGDIDSIYTVTYDTVVISTSGEISNSASLWGADEKLGNSSDKTYNASIASWGTGTGQYPRGAIRIIKKDAETGETIANNPAKFELYYMLNGEKRVVNGEAQVTKDGKIEYGSLPFRTYYLKEVEAPQGYELIQQAPGGYELKDGAIEIVIDKDNKEILMEIENTKEKIEIMATKDWDENNDVNVTRPDISFELWRKNGTAGEGQKVVDATKLANNKVNFGNQDKADIDGVEYEYFVKEVFDNSEDAENDNWVVIEDGLTVKNSVINKKLGKLIVEKVLENEIKDKNEITIFTITEPLKFSFRVTGPYGYKEDFVLIAGETKELTNLYYGDYKVEELNSHGYTAQYSVTNGEVTLTKDNAEAKVTVTNKRTDSPEDPNMVSKTLAKIWKNGPKPDTTIELWRIGQEVDGTVIDEKIGEFTATATETSKEFTGLAKHDPSGREFQYYAKEQNVPENYEVSISGVVVTNTYVIPKTEIDIIGNKIWDMSNDESVTHPHIKFELWRKNGIAGEGEKVVDATELTNNKVNFGKQDKTDINGVEYEYFVKEVFDNPKDAENDNWVVIEEGLTVTNSVIDKKRGELTVKKILKNEFENRMVQLTTNEPTKFNFKVTGPYGYEERFDLAAGETKVLSELYYGEYIVQETNTLGYIVTIDPENGVVHLKEENNKVTVTVTNSRTGKDGDLNAIVKTVTKIWENGPKPTTTIELWRRGFEVDGALINEKVDEFIATAIETSKEFKGLAKHDPSGREFEYYALEPEVPENYMKSENGLTLTNTYVIPKTAVTAKKEWIAGPEEKPTVWFKLYRQISNGKIEEVPEAEIKELSNGITEVRWTELDKTDLQGNEYTFSVKEVDTEGNDFTPISYVKTENGLEITNHYVSPTDASAKAIKAWENGPVEKPTIWFKLYRQIADGEKEAVPLKEAPIKELSSGTTEVVWTGLTKTNLAGQEYIFSVKEVDAEGNDFTPENYTKLEDGLIVTNTYVIPKTKVTGKKVWVGGSSVKPTIELQLYRDGEPYGETVELKDGETEYTWIDLDKTDINGREYKYTIDEVSVLRNYRKSVSEDGLTITNRYVPPYEPPYEPPTKPTDPDPKDPEKPVEPTKPVEPEKPTEPPTEPVVPVDPTKPTEPPTDPVVPVEPTNPTEPMDPEKPTVPTEPTIKEKTPKEKPIEIDPKIPEGSTPKVVEEPKNGKVTFDENGKWIYTPNPDFVGKDSFVIKVTHPDGTEEDIFIEIDVEAPAGGVEVPTLPKTGQANSILMYLAGLFFIVVGIILRKRIA